jgi:hypothetical protein
MRRRVTSVARPWEASVRQLPPPPRSTVTLSHEETALNAWTEDASAYVALDFDDVVVPKATSPADPL